MKILFLLTPALLPLLSLAQAAPALSVSSGSPAAQSFVFTFPGAPYDQVTMRFGAANANACLLLYQGGAFNWLYLFNDDGSLPWTPNINPVAPGSNATLSNSQCSVKASSVTVTTSGSVTTVSARISFAARFAGPRPISMQTYIYPTAVTPWVDAGTWSVPGIVASAPVREIEYEATLGATNGVNTVFTLANAPNTAPDVYLNGIKQRLGADYSLSGQIVTFLSAPSQGAYVEADYWKQGPRPRQTTRLAAPAFTVSQ